MEASTNIPVREHDSSEQLREKATRVKNDLADLGVATKEVAREKFAEWRTDASTLYRKGREKAQKFEQSVEGSIREHPVRAVLIAAGVGLLVGYLLRRRR